MRANDITGGLGARVPGGAASGGPTVNVMVSPEDSAAAVARKVSPAIVRSVRGVQSDIEASTQRRADLGQFEASLGVS